MTDDPSWYAQEARDARDDDYWPGYDTPYGQTEPNPDNPED